MYLLKSVLVYTVLISTEISCRLISSPLQFPEKQLFLSRNVVTLSEVFDGGVIVDERGVIEAVLTKESVKAVLAESYDSFQIIDGGELALMAGVVDSHVHVNEPGRTSWEGYVTATEAAAVGGITTIIDMPLNSIPPTTTVNNLKVKAAMAREEVYVDVGFWGGVVPGNELELENMVNAGVVGFKCFLIDSGVSEFPYVSKDDLENVFAVLNGTGTVLAFHAELQISNTSSTCDGYNCPNPVLYETYLATHPEEMELAAVSLVASLLNKTEYFGIQTHYIIVEILYAVAQFFLEELSYGREDLYAFATISTKKFHLFSLHVHIVHVSAEGIVPILEQAREERIKSGYIGWRGGVTAETCNHYLTLSSEYIPPGHTEFKCSPPIRNNSNKQKLWQYINEQRLDLIASDHSPSVADLKGANFLEAWGGISSVQFDLSLFWTEAKARGYSLSEVSHFLSAGPAHLCGLQEKKGAIRPGLDADLIFFDPNASFVVTPEIIRYKNKISPYMYRVLNGRVKQTYLRGQLVFADGELIGSPKGQLLLNEDFLYN